MKNRNCETGKIHLFANKAFFRRIYICSYVFDNGNNFHTEFIYKLVLVYWALVYFEISTWGSWSSACFFNSKNNAHHIFLQTMLCTFLEAHYDVTQFFFLDLLVDFLTSLYST